MTYYSPTQIETHELCKRKRWFTHVQKVKEIIKGSAAIGTALHGVVERYLRADEIGRNPDGSTAVMFPREWWRIVERDGRSYTLNVAEQSIVEKLFNAAVEGGLLVRTPGRRIEHEFKLPLGGPDFLVGKIDLLEGLRVTDHKTVKSMRYAKSQNELSNSIQMNVYGYTLLKELEAQGAPLPQNIEFRHIAYCKDPDDLRVRATSVLQPVRNILTVWNSRVLPAIDSMRKNANAKRWDEVPPPENIAKACNAYGGCSFMGICTGRENLKDYLRRSLTAADARVDSAPTIEPTPSTTKESIMGIFSSIRKDVPPAAAAAPINTPANPAPAAAPAAQAPAPAPAAPKGVFAKAAAPAPAAPVAAPAAAAAPAENTPPWAWSSCGACRGAGWNTAGNPCRICMSDAQEKGRPMPDQFVIIGLGKNAVWELKATGETASGPLPAAAGGTATAVPEKAPEVAPEKPAPAPAPAPEAPAVEKESAEEGRGRGRPKTGFYLVIGAGATFCKVDARKIVHLPTFYSDLANELAKDRGLPSPYAMNAFERREALAQAVPLLISQFNGGDFVIAPNCDDPDIRHFVERLRPHAALVLESTR